MTTVGLLVVAIVMSSAVVIVVSFIVALAPKVKMKMEMIKSNLASKEVERNMMGT